MNNIKKYKPFVLFSLFPSPISTVIFHTSPCIPLPNSFLLIPYSQWMTLPTPWQRTPRLAERNSFSFLIDDLLLSYKTFLPFILRGKHIPASIIPSESFNLTLYSPHLLLYNFHSELLNSFSQDPTQRPLKRFKSCPSGRKKRRERGRREKGEREKRRGQTDFSRWLSSCLQFFIFHDECTVICLLPSTISLKMFLLRLPVTSQLSNPVITLILYQI